VRLVSLSGAALLAAAIAFSVSTLAPAQHDHEAALKNPDGSWKYTNELIDSSSPYLLQHAHNPVDWREWSDETLELAREQDKPIFLSVGYSTCYWCHVMERKVFSDPDIAAIMNEDFINIKIDRETRPDIDQIYMMATRLMTRSGGWPNSVFLTPELKPFFAGTYFGPEDQGRRPGFPRLLRAISDGWNNQRDQMLSAADRLAGAIRQALSSDASASLPQPALDHSLPDAAAAGLAQRYDEEFGGFGLAPKFPQGFSFPFLFDVADRQGDASLAKMALHTLEMMAAGGIHDHVGGGFHRYSTDEKWYVPHFEKMLYNQAQLARAYVQAHERTGDPAPANVARGIFRYVDELMTSPDGGFYSALDAETDAVEGAYYVWSEAQLDEALEPEQRELLNKTFRIAPVPRIRGHKHPGGGTLVMRAPLDELADQIGVERERLRTQLDDVLATLKAARDERQLPRLDDKVIAAWNGLMIDAYAFAGAALDEPSYISRAQRAASFVLETLVRDDGRLMRIWRRGEVEQEGFIQDYAMVIRGLLSLHRVTEDGRWLDAAVRLTDQAGRLFWDQDDGGYFFAAPNPHLLTRSKQIADSAIPSGNSVMAHNLLRLAAATGEDRYRDRAKAVLTQFAAAADRSPPGYLHFIHAIERLAARGADDDASGKAAVRLPQSFTEPDDAPGGLASADRVAITVQGPSGPVQVDEEFTVRTRLKIDDGWHINAADGVPPGLIPSEIDVRSAAPIEVLEIEYPEPETLDAPFADEPIPVYSGEIEILATARLREAAPSDGRTSLRVLWRVQACDDRRCLRASEGVETIPLP